MSKDWTITQESFDALLVWLDPDREKAGRKYEAIRTRLIKIFICRGFNNAEDLADETINRVTAKVKEMIGNYVGEPALFFYGVAQKICLESLRTRQIPAENSHSSIMPDVLNEDVNPEYECLEKCLQGLPSDQRELVLEYYKDEKKAKIDHRKQLADKLGIAMNALRIRAFRIRASLQQCVLRCMETNSA
jgi:DNA-directed RNA polymerase specialized sigma24 family protein